MNKRIHIAESQEDARKSGDKLQERTPVFALGEIRIAVLALLKNGPRHGYGIMKDLGTRVPHYRASAGSVYPALKELESEGLVECELHSGRKTYALTRRGRREAAKHSGIFDRFKNAPQHETASNSGDVTTSLHRVLKAAYGAAEHTVGRSREEASLRAILNRTAGQLERLIRKNRQEGNE